jgi:hypothetical protein
MKIFAIARVTFFQVVRQPIYGILLLLALGIMAMAPSVTAFTMDDDNKMLQDLCLSTILLVGLIISAFAAAGAVSDEIDDQTILTILTKPVNRLAFIFAKAIGIIAALAVAYLYMSLVYLLVLRHGVLWAAYLERDLPVLVFGLSAVAGALLFAAVANYLFEWKFQPTALTVGLPLLILAVILTGFFDKSFKFQTFGTLYSGQVFAASYLLLLATSVLAAVCLASSTRFNVVWTMLIAFITLCLGMTWDNLVLAPLNAATTDLARAGWSVLYAIVPNFQEFWMIDALNAGKTLQPIYLLTATGYAAVYIAAMVLIAFALFLGRQIGAANRI